jgi:hypothetical protein
MAVDLVELLLCLPAHILHRLAVAFGQRVQESEKHQLGVDGDQ